jgi:hypothetical protein
MKKLLATLAIAALPVVGLAGVAHAQEVGTPANPLPNGLCLQPLNPVPLQVPCTDPRATTAYVVPDLSATVDQYPQDPSHLLVRSDGTCVEDRVYVPKEVACPTAPTTAAPAAPIAPIAHHATTRPVHAAATFRGEPASLDFAFWHGI